MLCLGAPPSPFLVPGSIHWSGNSGLDLGTSSSLTDWVTQDHSQSFYTSVFTSVKVFFQVTFIL